ncbi:MAG: HAD family phosphatase [Candidatus Omnitrophica bacterium]|nr:HAD family phosphatase [Candidatus Omnitrophota bacterium]
MIRLLVFDFDGTLLDTETPDYDSLASIYSEHGCELPLEFWALSLGTNPSPVDLFENLEMQIAHPVDREKWQSERKRRFYSLVEKEDPRPGIISLLGEVKSKGIAIGLASSAGRDWVEKHLNRTGLRDYFQCVRTVEDVIQAKPAPDLYLSVLDFFGIAGGFTQWCHRCETRWIILCGCPEPDHKPVVSQWSGYSSRFPGRDITR